MNTKEIKYLILFSEFCVSHILVLIVVSHLFILYLKSNNQN